MSERAPCVVVGCCNSSAKWAGSRYICSKHWPLVPKASKRRYRLVCRRRDREADPARKHRLQLLAWRMWDRLERLAQERAVGIG